MYTTMKTLIARLLLLFVLLGSLLTPMAIAEAQNFENATGLNAVSDTTQSGVDTQKLGIYGPTGTGDTNLVVIITNIINSVFLLLGFAAVALLIFEGVLLIMSRGDEKQQENVKKTIINIAIGFGVILLSYAIVNQILAILGARDINTRNNVVTGVGDLQRQVGIDQTNIQWNFPGSVGYSVSSQQMAFAKIPTDLYKKLTLTYAQSADSSKAISADYRSVDYEFVAGSARLPALRGSLLRVTKAEWDQVKSGSFGLFIPGNDTISGAKAWVKSTYVYAAPSDARNVSVSNGNSATGASGRFVDLKPIIDRINEGVESPNVVQVQIPGQTTASLTVVVLKPGEEDRYVFGAGEAFADYNSLNPASSATWTDIENGKTVGYDRRRSYFKVKNSGNSLEARTYTTGASIQLNNGLGDKDIEAEVTLSDQNTLPESFQTLEHTITRGDGTLIKDAAKNGETFKVTIPLGDSVYLVDDITAILKDGRRVNIGTNTIVLGNNSDPRLVAQNGLGQLVVNGTYASLSGTKNVRLMPKDSVALTKAVDKPVTLKSDIQFYGKQTPTLIDVVSPGLKDGFVRFVDGEITRSGNALNGVTPFRVTPELTFDKTGSYPVTIAIRDYTLGQTLAVMDFTVRVFDDGTDITVNPNYVGTVGNSYKIRTFPAFTESTSLESKRVEIKRNSSTGSGGQTVLNRTLSKGLDDFDYVFDQDGEYTFTVYNKFAGVNDESVMSKSLVVLPQAPQVDFTLSEKPGNPTIFELTDASRYLEEGTVFVDASPYDASFAQSEWKTVGTKRVKELTFGKPGTYRVTVTGRNKYGETSTKSSDITVSTDITYDIQLLDSQDNIFPQNQTPRYPKGQAVKTRVIGKNIGKVEVGYGATPALTTISSGSLGEDGRTTFSGSLQIAEEGQYSLTYTMYSVTKPTEKALVVTRNILIRRPLEPLADFSVSEGGAVIPATPGACIVSGAAKEGYIVTKNREYLFDGSTSLASSDLPVNRDSTTTGFRWNIATRELSAKSVSVRDRFVESSQDSANCVPVTFTILENVNGQAKTSQMVKYFKVQNSLPTYDSFVVEWPNGALTTPMSVRAKLRGLRDPDEPNQNIQVLWFYEVQGNQLFNEVSYDTERLIRLENYGAAGSVNTYRIGAQIYDMNTKESVKVYSDPRTITTGVNPALQSTLVEPGSLSGLGYVPWVKGSSPFRMVLGAKMSDGANVSSPSVVWSMQRYGTLEGCSSIADPVPLPIASTGLSSSVSFPLCGLYRITALISSGGQTSQQTVALRVYDSDVGLSPAEKPVFASLSGLRGAASDVIAVYEPPKENNVSPFFPTATGTTLSPVVRATYMQGLSPSVAKQATTNGSYAASSGTQLTASYTSVSDMLTSYNLPANVINDQLAAQNPGVDAQVRALRSEGRNEAEIQSLLAKNLAGSAIQYDPTKPYQMPFGTAYDVYAEFGLRPASALKKVSSDDAALGKKIAELRQRGQSDDAIVQTLRNEANLQVSTNLHAAAEVPANDVLAHLVTQGLSRKEIVDKILVDNPTLEGYRSELLEASSNAALLDAIEKHETTAGGIEFQPLSPLRVSIGRAYLLLKERAYTDALIVDKLRADDPDIAAIVLDLKSKGTSAQDILRRLLSEPGREVALRVSSAIVSNFDAIYETLRHHGLSEETIYEKLRSDDETFRAVYDALRKKTSDRSLYYQEFSQEATLKAMTYKPESMFVLPLRLAYGEYISMGLTPEEAFMRLAKDNPNFGQDYETLKREKSQGVEIFTSLIKNGAERKVRFSYMRPIELPAANLAHFFMTQGIPEELAMQKVVADNPMLSSWYQKQGEGKSVPSFADLLRDYPTNSFLIAQFTGWDTTLTQYARAMNRTVSAPFALAFLASQDAEMGRLVSALKAQKQSDGEILTNLTAANGQRTLRLFPYMGASIPLRSATRELSVLYSSEDAIIGHFARFDAAFGAYFAQASARLYSAAQILGAVGDRFVYIPAFRPVVAEPEPMLRSLLASGLSTREAFALYAPYFPEIDELLNKVGDKEAELYDAVRSLYPRGTRIPLIYLTDEKARSTFRAHFGLSEKSMQVSEYIAWLRGWGVSSDIALWALAGTYPDVARILQEQKDASIDARVQAVSNVLSEVRPEPLKKFAVPFVSAYRMYERRGLSSSMIYNFLAAQDPVFQSVYTQLRADRVPANALFDALKANPQLATVVTNPLLPADMPTLLTIKNLEQQQISSDIIAQKIATDQPMLQAEAGIEGLTTAIAKDSFLQVVPFSLARPVQLTGDQKKSLLQSYGVNAEISATLASISGSGMTLPPQLLVDIPTYVDVALEQGIAPQQLVEDVMRLVPDQAGALQSLLTAGTSVSDLRSGLSSSLGAVSMLPLFTKAPVATQDEQVIAFDVRTKSGVQDATGYIPGTVPVTNGSLNAYAEGEQLGFTQVAPFLFLPAGIQAYVQNPIWNTAREAFALQSADGIQQFTLIPNDTAEQLTGLLSASGALLRSAAPDAKAEPLNVYGVVGDTTLLDCSSYSIVLTVSGEQSLICTTASAYESSLDLYRTTLLRNLGEQVPEEISTLMAAFDRALSLEDRLEAMQRLRERTGRLAVSEAQINDLLARLAMVRVFDIDATLGKTLAKRGADDLRNALHTILDAAGSGMQTDRGSFAEAFRRLQEATDPSTVLVVRYSLAISDVLKSQTIDPIVKDMVISTMDEHIEKLLASPALEEAAKASNAVAAEVSALKGLLKEKKYTIASVGQKVTILRTLAATSMESPLDLEMQQFIKALGSASAVQLATGISDVAQNRSAILRAAKDLILRTSLWERQRRGMLAMLDRLTSDQRYNAAQKEDILMQLVTARRTYLQNIRGILENSDVASAQKAMVLALLDKAISATNLASMLSLEEPVWGAMNNDLTIGSSEKFPELLQTVTDFNGQLQQATENIIAQNDRAAILPGFALFDFDETRQKDLADLVAKLMTLLSQEEVSSLRSSFTQGAAAASSTFTPMLAQYSTAEGTNESDRYLTLMEFVQTQAAATEPEKRQFAFALEQYLQALVTKNAEKSQAVGQDLLVDLRTRVDADTAAIVTANLDMRSAAHLVHDLKKTILAHPTLPLQYKMEMLFETQHVFPFYSFARAFALCTPVYVKDTKDIVRRICAEEKNQGGSMLPVEKSQLFAFMQTSVAKRPEVATGALLASVQDSLETLTTKMELTHAERQSIVAGLSRMLESPEVSYADRQKLLAYVYQLPVIGDEMLAVSETTLTLDNFYLSIGELESRLRAIMLGVAELPTSLRGTVREALMQVKKYYGTEVQRSNVMVSLAANVLRGSTLSDARKETMVRALDTIGDTMQPVPVTRLTPEVSLERLDAILGAASTAPGVDGLLAAREDLGRLLGQGDTLGAIGVLSRMEGNIGATGLSEQEKSDLGFYTVIARDFLTYVQSQGPRTADVPVELEEPQTTVDPMPTVAQVNTQPSGDGSPFWTILWGIAYVFVGLLLFVLTLGGILYVLFLYYKKTHPEIHVDFEEYILLLRGQLAVFMKRFSKEGDLPPDQHRIPDEPLPEKPLEPEEQVSDSQAEAPEQVPDPAPVPAPVAEQIIETPPAPPAAPAAPSWLQIGDAKGDTASAPVNPTPPEEGVQQASAPVQSTEEGKPLS